MAKAGLQLLQFEIVFFAFHGISLSIFPELHFPQRVRMIRLRRHRQWLAYGKYLSPRPTHKSTHVNVEAHSARHGLARKLTDSPVSRTVRAMKLANPIPCDAIVEGECLTAMARLPAASVDLVFADPPY